MRNRITAILASAVLLSGVLAGCGAGGSEPDDYVTNDGYETVAVDAAATETGADVDTSEKVQHAGYVVTALCQW